MRIKHHYYDTHHYQYYDTNYFICILYELYGTLYHIMSLSCHNYQTYMYGLEYHLEHNSRLTLTMFSLFPKTLCQCAEDIWQWYIEATIALQL